MTGLSNQALSSALRRPLLTLLEARPIGIVGRSGFNLRILFAGTIPGVRLVRVMIATERLALISLEDCPLSRGGEIESKQMY
jgi:hypothetical protein